METQNDVEYNLKLPKQILELGPEYFHYVFMKPTQRKISYIISAIFAILRLFMIGMSLYLLPQAETIMILADAIQGASAFTQGFKSTIPMVFYKDELLWLMSESVRYWPTNDETQHVESFYKKIISVLLFYKRLFFFTYGLYVPVGLILHKLPFLTWIPPIPHGYYVMYTLQFFILTFDAVVVHGSDSFFIGTCMNIRAQFKILQNRMENLGKKNVENIDKEIIECVQQHNFLLDYANVLIKMYSIGSIFQFFVTTSSLCIEIFVFTRRSGIGIVVAISYCSMLTSQLAIYCFPADEVIEASHQCANAIYECPWYDHNEKLKHIVINCMQRSQKRLIFTAGGFIDIDKTAFTKIFKGILSLNTLMKEVFE